MATHRQRQLTTAGIRAGHIVSRLQKHADGKIEMSPTQIQAAKILLDRALPTLSSVEQTILDPAASMSEAEITAQLLDLARKYPQVLRSVVNQLSPTAVDAAHKPSDDDAEVKAVA